MVSLIIDKQFNILHDQLNLSDGKQSYREKQTPDDNN